MIGKILAFLFKFIGLALTIAFIVLEIYVWTTYGLAPAGEVPAWALFLMFKS